MDQETSGRRRPGPKPMDPSRRRRGVSLSLPPELVAALDDRADSLGLTRSEASVEVLRAGFAALEVADRLGGRAA